MIFHWCRGFPGPSNRELRWLCQYLPIYSMLPVKIGNSIFEEKKIENWANRFFHIFITNETFFCTLFNSHIWFDVSFDHFIEQLLSSISICFIFSKLQHTMIMLNLEWIFMTFQFIPDVIDDFALILVDSGEWTASQNFQCLSTVNLLCLQFGQQCL